MRWIAAQTALVLLMCTVFSCTGLAAEHAHARQTQTPPCHQHQKPAAPQDVSPCDHQQAVTTGDMGVTPDAVCAPVAVLASPLAAEMNKWDLPAFVERPPGSTVQSSVLRI